MKWSDGMEIAEAEAWAAKGRSNPNFFVYRRLFVPGLIAAGVGAAGYGVFRGWSALASRPDDGHVPSLMWFLLIPLLLGTFFGFKGTGRVRPFGVLIAVGLILALAWLLWLGALGYMLT